MRAIIKRLGRCGTEYEDVYEVFKQCSQDGET